MAKGALFMKCSGIVVLVKFLGIDDQLLQEDVKKNLLEQGALNELSDQAIDASSSLSASQNSQIRAYRAI